jgi:hypothetical protein
LAVVAVYDACVLYPAPLRDFLLRIAKAGAVQPKWSRIILDECFRSILTNRPDLSPNAFDTTKVAMERAFPSANVEDFELLIPTIDLPDRDDRHVVAAAVHGRASVIVTLNLRDFPPSALEPLGVAALHPDEFVLERMAEGTVPILAALAAQVSGLKAPPSSTAEVLARLSQCGLPRSVARIRAEMGDAPE